MQGFDIKGHENILSGGFFDITDRVTPVFYETKKELITIKVYGSQVDYIKARPIHSSQTEIEQGNGWSIFSYWLKPSYNFYQAPAVA